jgi:LysM repeat protein
MSGRQVVLIVLLNAVVSLLISVAVVWLALTQWAPRQTSYAPLSSPSTLIQPTPPKSDVLYVVQQGDSLSGIALRFGVPIGDLMRANDLTDPNRISVGQRLIIPAGPVAERTATRSPSPTLTTLPFDPPTPVTLATAAPPSATAEIKTPASATPAPSPTAR